MSSKVHAILSSLANTIMSIEQHSDSAPEQDSDSEQDSQFSNLSSNTDVTKIFIGKINKFDHRFDYALFYGDFSKFLSCAGWAGKRGIGQAGLIKIDIFPKSTTIFSPQII